MVDGIVGDSFRREIGFVDYEGGGAAHDGRIFFANLRDEGCEARVVGEVLEAACGAAGGIKPGVSLRHFFEEVESFRVLADLGFVEGEIEEGGGVVGMGGKKGFEDGDLMGDGGGNFFFSAMI